MPTVRLSSADVLRLEQAAHVLLSPLTARTLDEWRAPVAREIGELLGADKATFILAAADEAPSYCEGNFQVKPALIAEYLKAMDAKRFRIWQKEVALGVFARSQLYTPVYRSAYYGDWIVPTRSYDAIGLALEAGTTGVRTSLLFHHDRPNGHRLG